MSACLKQLKNNHILIESQKDMAEICKPLFACLRISYFHFRRTFKDGSYLVLATDSNWPLYFIENNIPVKTPVSHELFNSKSYFCLWQGNIPDQTLLAAREFFGIKNALAFVEKNDEYFDSYSFSSAQNCEMSAGFYVNNLDAFSNFVPYFKENAAKLIIEAEKQLIVPPTELIDLSIKDILTLKFHDEKTNFLN